jgi:folate-binding protein YgfZ
MGAIFDFSSRGKIEVRGEDRVSFLHNLLTNDIEALKPGQGCYAFLLNAQAKILADMHVLLFTDHVLLDTEPGVQDKLLGLLEKYIITEDVSLADVSKQYFHWAFEGPKTADLLKKWGLSLDRRGSHAAHAYGEAVVMHWTSLHGAHLLTRDKQSAEKAVREAQALGFYPAGEDLFETLRIEHGHLRYGKDMNENIALPETGLDACAASETKGCYPGQEVVARTNTYKGWQKKAVRLLLEGTNVPAAGTPVLDLSGKEAGKITSACWSPQAGRPCAIALISKGYFDLGTNLPGAEVRALKG